MTLSELKVALRQLTKLYFKRAEVTFTKQSFRAKPTGSLVTLSMAPVSRPMNPPVKVIDGRPVAFYPASTSIRIDLFTNGAQEEVEQGFTPIAENTAEDDMLAFASFLNSEYVVQWCHERDIAIVVPPTVQDLTGLIHDTLTVTEKMDGAVKRTFTATRKTNNSFAVTGEYFQKLLNGQHTMVIQATDGKVTVTRTLKFTKKVTRAVITLESPMEADAQITICAINVMGSIPADATFSVKVTNNGKDGCQKSHTGRRSKNLIRLSQNLIAYRAEI